MGEAGINKTAKLVTSEEMRLLEDRASQQGIDNAILMERAAVSYTHLTLPTTPYV